MTPAVDATALRPQLQREWGLIKGAEDKVRRRPYQDEAIRQAYRWWWEHREWALVSLPTGTGKTILSMGPIIAAVRAGLRVWFLVPRSKLATQTVGVIRALYPDVAKVTGLVQGARNECGAQLVIGTIQTATRSNRRDAVLEHGPIGLVVVDEAHGYTTEARRTAIQAICDHADDAGALPTRVLGLTATPGRKGLGSIFRLVYSYALAKALAEGFLAPPRFEVREVDELELPDLPPGADDYSQEQIEEAVAMCLGAVVDETVDAIAELAGERRGVVFCTRVDQAHRTAAALRLRGIPAAAIDGGMSEAQQDAILDAHRRGELRVVTNCDLLTEGYDDPEIGFVCVARPTRSKVLFLQIIGRGLRLHPEKEDCLVIDIAGASKEHSLAQASVLLEDEDDERDPRPENREPEEQEPTNPYKWLTEHRRRLKCEWTPIRGLDRRGYAVDLGEAGTVVVLEVEPGAWRPVVIPRRPKGEPRPPCMWAADEPVDVGLAMLIAEDLVSTKRGTGRLAKKDQDWREQPVTEGQVRILTKHGRPVPETRGEASAAITALMAGFDLVAHGLARRRR